MNKVIIFGGTTEGRQLAEALAGAGIGSIYCVATEYGKQPVEKSEYIVVRAGRMNWQEMVELFKEVNPDAIVDATHPFAEVVKKEIENAIFSFKQVPFFRVSREESDIDYSNCSFFDTVEDCVAALVNTSGRILLTTGSKELGVFCKDEGLRERIIARVIPGTESLKLCADAGLKGNQIIAMQGPFSAGMNLAFIRECDAKVLVMKESGQSSGEAERIIAANKAKIKCFIIKRPEEKIAGLSLYQVKEELFELFGVDAAGLSASNISDVKIAVTLAGFGMGFGSITSEVEQAILEADYLFGAPRLLVGIDTDCKKYPYYLAKDIIPKLDELAETIESGTKKAVVLFSGDTGFYSGAQKLKTALEKMHKYRIKILPGISSVSALASRLSQVWQDAEVISTHGVADDVWIPDFLDKVVHNESIYVLTSGSSDVRLIGDLLSGLEEEKGIGFTIYVGNNLYADEKISKLTSDKCANYNEDGLCTLLIKNPAFIYKRLTPGLKDSLFLRDAVPMSKEEVRALSICKLGITKNAVCYDIGSGTGSVAVEMGLLDPSVDVYAIELKEDACILTEKNIDRFQARNVHMISGTAPEALAGLPAPTHVFIGGSGGRLDEIIATLKSMDHKIKVVINAVSVETIAEISGVLKKYEIEDADIVQVAVSKVKKAGEHSILHGQNPVGIITFSI